MLMKKESSQKINTLKAITKLHQSIGARLNLVGTARTLVKELIDILKCDACAIISIKKNDIKILATRGFSKKFRNQEILSKENPLCRSIAKRKIYYAKNIQETMKLDLLHARGSTRSIVYMPIVTGKKIRYILYLASKKGNGFNQSKLKLIELLAVETSQILQRSKKYSKVKDLSIKDGLTGCLNRRQFDRDIEEEVTRSKRYKRPLSLLMIDIDRFKIYNDFHGHQKGDALLKNIAKLIQRKIRAIDKVYRLYRYGGEEFAILLPETNPEGALSTAKRVRNKIKQTEFWGEERSQPSKKVTVSIGISTLSSQITSKEELIKSADKALFQAKRSGRNKVSVLQ